MANPLYLTEVQKKIIDESGIGISKLTWESLETVLAAHDVRVIEEQSRVVFSPGGMLWRLGIPATYGLADPDVKKDTVYAVRTHNGADSFLNTKISIDCFCYKDKYGDLSFVVWEVIENTDNHTNNMAVSRNLRKIITAMGKLMGFAEIKQTPQFAMALCAE